MIKEREGARREERKREREMINDRDRWGENKWKSKCGVIIKYYHLGNQGKGYVDFWYCF